MKLQIFSIYDTKADAYLQPFFTATKATALRSFSDLVNNPDSTFSKHASDYVLFHIASYDDQNGHIEPLSSNLNLGGGLELQQSPTEELT